MTIREIRGTEKVITDAKARKLMSSKMYRLDRSQFKAQTFQEADNNREYWLTQSVEDRLKAAWFLTMQAYGFSPGEEPSMDKTVFGMRKHKV